MKPKIQMPLRQNPPTLFIGAVIASLFLCTTYAGTLGEEEPPVVEDGVETDAPVNNGLPNKDDPDNSAGNDSSSDCPESTGSGGGSSGGGEEEDDDDAEGDADEEELQDSAEEESGDPVLLHNGAVSRRETDVFLPGRGMHFYFTRRYNSKRSHEPGPLGYGWSHSCDVFVDVQANGDVHVHNGNGRIDKYKNTGSSFQSPPGMSAVLSVEASPDTYSIRTKHGTRTFFNAAGKMRLQRDSNGNEISYTYNSNGILTNVVDTFGRKIEFDHNSTTGFLESVTYADKRSVKYKIDGNGNLHSVTSPGIDSTGGWNDAKSGRTRVYTYSSGYADPKLNHDLLSVIEPTEVADGSNKPSLVFTYYDQNGPWYQGWAKTQTSGGTHAGYTSGGVTDYLYRSLDTSTPLGNRTIPRIETTVNRADQNTSVYTFNENGHALFVTKKNVETVNGFEDLTTAYQYDSNGEIARVDYPEGDYVIRTYQTGGHPSSIGNLISVERFPGIRGASQAKRTRTMQYEPIFNHLCRTTDHKGNSWTYTCDYQEGSYGTGSATDLRIALADELGVSLSVMDSIAAGMSFFDADLNGDQNTTQLAGNRIMVQAPNVMLSTQSFARQAQLEGDPIQEAITTYAYNSYGQKIATTDPEENTVLRLHYPLYRPFARPGGLDASATASPMSGGMLWRVVTDATLPYSSAQVSHLIPRNHPSDIGANTLSGASKIEAKQDFAYGPTGRLELYLCPRGVLNQYYRNEVDEIWKQRTASDVSQAIHRASGFEGSSENLSGQAFDYEQYWFYDARGRLELSLIENKDNTADQGKHPGYIETKYAYDLLNQLREKSSETGRNGMFSVTSYGYNAVGYLTAITSPEKETIHFENDAKGNAVRTIEALNTPIESTSVVLRDKNGGIVLERNGEGFEILTERNGFDEVRIVTDPVGARTFYQYGPNGKLVSKTVWGHPAGMTPAVPNDHSSNVAFSRMSMEYDTRSQLVAIHVEDLFAGTAPLVDGDLSPGDGRVTTFCEYDRMGRPTHQVDDGLRHLGVAYDGASRRIRTVDGMGNVLRYEYNDGGGLQKIRQTDLYPDNSTRTFSQLFLLDSLGRTTTSVSPTGHTRRMTYDSRSNLIRVTDAKGPVNGLLISGIPVNQPGNAVSFLHDGENRLIRSVRDLHVGGNSSGALDSSPFNPDGRSTQHFVRDLNGRIKAFIDDLGNRTIVDYDPKGRMEEIRYPNQALTTMQYDKRNLPKTITRPNGTVAVFSYDQGGRRTMIDAVVPGGTPYSTAQRFEYNGSDNLTKATDSNNHILGDGNDITVIRGLDGVGRVIAELQGNKLLRFGWEEMNHKVATVYPSGPVVRLEYDAIRRIKRITSNNSMIAQYTFAGSDRTLQVQHGNGVVNRMHDGQWGDSLFFDNEQRLMRDLYLDPQGGVIEQFDYQYDRANLCVAESRTIGGGLADNFAYDSLARVVTYEKDVPSSQAGILGSGLQSILANWEVDGAQNWRSIVVNGIAEQFSIGNRNILQTNADWIFGSDLEGNVTEMGKPGSSTQVMTYDFLRRLRSVTDSATNESTYYSYDALGRRVATRFTDADGGVLSKTLIYDDEMLIEEYDSSQNLSKRFFHGRKVDEVVRMDSQNGDAMSSFYIHGSPTGDTRFVSDSSGTVVERMRYSPFGMPTFYDGAGNATAATQSVHGIPFLFQGRYWEPNVRPMYYYRSRYYSPELGRFMHPDPLGDWYDSASLGNGFAFEGNNPVNWTDPFGTEVYISHRPVNGWKGKVVDHKAVVVKNDSGTKNWSGTNGKHNANGDYGGPGKTTGHLVVQKDNPNENGDKEGQGKDEVKNPYPDEITQEEWDDAVTDAANRITEELGEYRAPLRGSPAEAKDAKDKGKPKPTPPGGSGIKAPWANGPVEYGHFMGSDCWNFADWVIAEAKRDLKERNKKVKEKEKKKQEAERERARKEREFQRRSSGIKGY